MRIIIEEYQYPADKVKDVLDGISTLRDINGKVSVNYVGYYYNPTLKDCVFILPKVLLDEEGQVFGHCSPDTIIDLEKCKDILSSQEYDFVYELAVWIYRAIVVYRDDHTDSTIVLQQNVQQMSKGRLHKCNTFLDILLAILKFNRENQDFFFFILKNIHSGYNKINWTRTINHSSAIMQKDVPIYLNPVNKKKQVNFDEELLIIFFSILHYVNIQYGFPVKININFPLITDMMFENYRNGMGKVRLMQIKYKYFSDKALYLWELCYAFFDQTKKINIETDDKEYLLVKNFNIVFEAIIDELVGDKIPAKDTRLKKLKEQPDGKLIDHIYRYKELTSNREEKPVYYIGDSKYYKRDTPIGEESVYKQFTYARNVIQWNLDLFNDPLVSEEERSGHQKLRDDVTEGYNVIPNFFISAQQTTLERKDDIRLTDRGKKYYLSSQFDNRLFDRDTFLIAHYDVNFLFIIALYGRNNSPEKNTWKNKVRDMFRREIQTMLEEHYNFHVMTPHKGVNASAYIQEHFQQLLGKVFTPYDNIGTQRYYSLALSSNKDYEESNALLLSQLEKDFFVEGCKIGDDPSVILKDKIESEMPLSVTPQFLTMHYLERYANDYILIGCYHDKKHLEWIHGTNDKGTKIYNIRLGDVPGGQVKAHLDKMVVRFVILYESGHESENRYEVYHVHHHAIMSADRLKDSGYPSEPSAKRYFCYVFDEEVTLGSIDINSVISRKRIDGDDYIDGMPIFKSGKDLLAYRGSSSLASTRHIDELSSVPEEIVEDDEDEIDEEAEFLKEQAFFMQKKRK